MFTFFYQFLDLVYLNSVGLFMVFFFLSWVLYITKILVSRKYKCPVGDAEYLKGLKVHVIVPVVDEEETVWRKVLTSLKLAMTGLDYKITVVHNGHNAIKETSIAKELGLDVKRLNVAGKRQALECGLEEDNGSDITLILDSDTIVSNGSIVKLLSVFSDDGVGGATPRHEIYQRNDNVMRVISDWLEDIRFNEVLKGQHEYVSCLPGRLFAIRTGILKEAMPYLVSQEFMKAPCISGDDRFLTSFILQKGMKAIYVSDALVYTNCPNTLGSFIKQRLRWSRTSLRETLRSLPWIGRYSYTALTTISNVVMRWFFFIVIVMALAEWVGITDRDHYFYLSGLGMFIGTVVGFFVSGFLRQLRHLAQRPSDIKYFVPFLLVTTFILTVVEWYGNITLRESGWMTRKVNG